MQRRLPLPNELLERLSATKTVVDRQGKAARRYMRKGVASDEDRRCPLRITVHGPKTQDRTHCECVMIAGALTQSHWSYSSLKEMTI